ncbi:MAG TPA: Fpg/Nei family DNA glycosylase, partial [Dietzia sp.]|nr:Fpg/Nei family DNA glycosylase [Dietzia sp.]
MPEGHTLHRLARLHTGYFAGGPVRVSSPQGRFADHVLVDGRHFERATATGKHLFHHYEGGLAVHVHLGLYGFFDSHLVPEGQNPPDPVGQVRMRVGSATGNGPAHNVDLRGPTRCEVLGEEAVAEVRDRLGPDPLDPAADPGRAWERIRRSSRPIGALLMDQKVLAGVGNVYRAEALFRGGLEPFRPGATMREGEFRGLWDDLVALMAVGAETGGIVT